MKSLAVAVFLSFALVACGTFNASPSIESKAGTLYASFAIAEDAAAEIVCPGKTVPCRPTVPAGAVRAVASADAVAKPLADTLATAARRYADAKAQAAAGGGTTAVVVAAALQQLTTAYAEAAPSIQALIAAVKQIKEN